MQRLGRDTTTPAEVAVLTVPVVVQDDDAHLEALYVEWREAESVWSDLNTLADETLMTARRSLSIPLHKVLSRSYIERHGKARTSGRTYGAASYGAPARAQGTTRGDSLRSGRDSKRASPRDSG